MSAVSKTYSILFYHDVKQEKWRNTAQIKGSAVPRSCAKGGAYQFCRGLSLLLQRQEWFTGFVLVPKAPTVLHFSPPSLRGEGVSPPAAGRRGEHEHLDQRADRPFL